MSKTLTITRPDDWHLHVRDGDMLRAVLPHTAKQFARAIIMPNLQPPITTVEMAQAYRDRILAAIPEGIQFEPLMTLYLTAQLQADEIMRAKQSGIIHGIKLYPAGATTNSAAGVDAIEQIYPALAAMEAADMPLLVHGESTDQAVDVFDRETVFLEQTLAPLLQRFPKLRVVLEHITTRAAAEFVTNAPVNVAATITPQHLLENRNAIFNGGIRPHYYCLPILKREQDREALIQAATSGSAKFFLGTDSAPHTRQAKETACGCAGCYTAYAALELYAQAFEQADALDKLEAFASFHGPDFYRLPRNQDTITLTRKDCQIPGSFSVAGDELVPFRAGEVLSWQLAV
ncbi:MAG TPA: dihydroorotase [Gammaproteobacteria bacterium]|nr:dihydroorotase [Gammaproteobacteria bacterium]